MIAPALFLALAQTAAPAATTTAPAPAASAPQAAPAYARLRQLGLSAAGAEALGRIDTAGAAEVRQAAVALRAAGGEVRTLAAAPTIDVARLGDALRRRDAARARLEALGTTRLTEALRVLSPADRAVLVRGAGLVRSAQGAAPASRPNRPSAPQRPRSN